MTPQDTADAPDFYLMDFAYLTLLVPGTQASIIWLAHAFASDRQFTLRQSTSQGTGSLIIKPTDNGAGTLIEADGHFLWGISQQEARDCREALMALANSERPAHQYLDPGSNEANCQIVVSLGEHDQFP